MPSLPTASWATAIAAAASLVATLPHGHLTAQAIQPVTIADRVTCSSCSIKLTLVTQLGNNYEGQEPGSQGSLVTIARNSRGYYYASYGGGNQGQLFVHAPDGRVEQVLGRRGDGPGEYQRVSALAVAPGDTVHVFDQSARRRTVLDPDGRVVRTSPLPGNPVRVLLLPRDAVLMHSSILTADQIGYPLHIIAPTGAIHRSFGSDTAVRRPDLSDIERREIAPSGPTSFWVWHHNEYRLEEWTTNGGRLRTVRRSPSWFRPRLRSAAMSPTVPPSPQPVGIASAGADRVWTVTRIADPKWKDALTEVRSESGRVVYRPNDLPGVYDSMIELIDVRTGTVVARARTPMALGRFADRDHLVSYESDSEDRPIVRVWRVQLIQ